MNYRGFVRHEKKFPNLSTDLWIGRAWKPLGLSGLLPVPQPSSDAIERALLGFSIAHETAALDSLIFGARELRATTGRQLAPTSFKVQSQDFRNAKGRQIDAES